MAEKGSDSFFKKRLASDKRAFLRNTGKVNFSGKRVVYWMQRAQRPFCNPALDFAINCANDLDKPLVVVFSARADIPRANERHYQFMFEGLSETARHLEDLGAPMLFANASELSLEHSIDKLSPALVVGDENPLRQLEHWRGEACRTSRGAVRNR
ncbi:MAG: deoxyribodipyrimidine photo-lyase [Planctomycetota bacterium]|nr:deoxyribodipyrimidine photo-lyase [Planctomycetota bacterium]